MMQELLSLKYLWSDQQILKSTPDLFRRLTLLTFMSANDSVETRVNFFSNGTISRTSGSLMPTNNGLRWKTSLCLGVKLPTEW